MSDLQIEIRLTFTLNQMSSFGEKLDGNRDIQTWHAIKNSFSIYLFCFDLSFFQVLRLISSIIFSCCRATDFCNQ